MSNWIYVEVQVVPSLLDGLPVVQVLASDWYESGFMRFDVLNFLKLYTTEGTLKKDIYLWDVFIDHDQNIDIIVNGFEKAIDVCNQIINRNVLQTPMSIQLISK